MLNYKKSGKKPEMDVIFKSMGIPRIIDKNALADNEVVGSSHVQTSGVRGCGKARRLTLGNS